MKKLDRTGEVYCNNFGSKMKIVEYKGSKKIKVYFEEFHWTSDWVQYDNIKRGKVQCPYERRVHEIGYLGEGEYSFNENQYVYNIWSHMLRRCYDKNYKEKRPTYEEAIVDNEWHNFQNFAEWYYKNYYCCNGEKMCLDKDILHKGNKIYSPKNCMIVPERINTLFEKSDNSRGDLPIGCHHDKERDKVIASLRINGKTKFLGRFNFNQVEEAFQSYKVAKEKYIKQVADEYKPYIPNKLYDAMYRYEVEITD